ncbi:hypothetical protein PTTG_28278 [Puccinia triticina 1-1 BBBD Race 1]|uniref:Uncharacterized protein n=1 Tax=Puccinia triticina (isolate 1-1 / race 1 (BBBD)) TaxID=630390 RepID=A0A180GDA4_PUCT1|nr:hypothetical protein PTTG_28278 [Puccinia triticina 1-1 BBBD Race 1]
MEDLPNPESLLIPKTQAAPPPGQVQEAPPPCQVTPFHIDYVLYVENIIYQPPPTSRGQTTAPPANQWMKMVRKPSLGPLAMNIQALSWRLFQNQVIIHICGNKENLAKFLDESNALGDITWYGSIYGHATYGVSHLFQVKNASDFSEITRAAAAAPNKKVAFKLTMVDPCEDQKDSAKQAQINTALKLKYGPPEERAILERKQRRLAANPKADTDPINPVVAKIRLKCVAHTVRGQESQALVFTCPEDPTRTMLLPFKQLWAWAQAIVNNEAGVDYNHPPTSDLFVWRLNVKSPQKDTSGALKPSKKISPSSKRAAESTVPVGQHAKRVSSFCSSISSTSVMVGVSRAPSGNTNSDLDEIEVIPTCPNTNPAPHNPITHPALHDPTTDPASLANPLPSTLGRSGSFGTDVSGIPSSAISTRFSAFPNTPAPLLPECPALESITLEEFLREANIPDSDCATRLRLELHGIRDWLYFRSSTELQLIQLDFPAGVARYLCEGVPRLYRRYAIRSMSPDDEEDNLYEE